MAVESEGLPLPAAPALEATSAVSRALQIVDIVQEILESLCSRPLTLSDYRAFIPTRKIVLCTALTCHSFLEPSLDILWRSMHSIAPLLKLLEGSRKSDGEDIFSGFPPHSTSSDWHRIKYYRRRIQTFYHDPTSLPSFPLPFHACHAIPHYFPFSLLPNLDTLHLGSFNPAYDAVLFILVSSPLRHVEICNIQPTSKSLVDSFLICLREKSHRIQHLALGGTCPSQFHQLAVGLSGLISLDLTQTVLDASVFQPTMHKIAKLRFVKAIGLDLGGSVKHVQSWETWSTSVEHLRLKGSARQITTFLTSHSMSHLRHIRLEFPSSYAKYTQPTEDWSNFKRTLLSMVSRWQHIQGIILDIEVFIPYISSQRSPFREILQPLKRLTQLKRLRIDPETPVRTFTSLSSTDYWELGNAFPGLEHLALPCGNIMTFDVLYKIALLCPRLRSLAVGIDTQIVPVPLSSQYPPIAHDLEVLSVGNSPLTNIPSVTRHLHRLFPRLKTIIATNSAWDPVLDFLELHKNMVMDSSERRASTTELLDHLKAKHALDLASSSAGRVDVSRGPKKKRGVKRT